MVPKGVCAVSSHSARSLDALYEPTSSLFYRDLYRLRNVRNNLRLTTPFYIYTPSPVIGSRAHFILPNYVVDKWPALSAHLNYSSTKRSSFVIFTWGDILAQTGHTCLDAEGAVWEFIAKTRTRSRSQ